MRNQEESVLGGEKILAELSSFHDQSSKRALNLGSNMDDSKSFAVEGRKKYQAPNPLVEELGDKNRQSQSVHQKKAKAANKADVKLEDMMRKFTDKSQYGGDDSFEHQPLTSKNFQSLHDPTSSQQTSTIKPPKKKNNLYGDDEEDDPFTQKPYNPFEAEHQFNDISAIHLESKKPKALPTRQTADADKSLLGLSHPDDLQQDVFGGNDDKEESIFASSDSKAADLEASPKKLVENPLPDKEPSIGAKHSAQESAGPELTSNATNEGLVQEPDSKQATETAKSEALPESNEKAPIEPETKQPDSHQEEPAGLLEHPAPEPQTPAKADGDLHESTQAESTNLAASQTATPENPDHQSQQ